MHRGLLLVTFIKSISFSSSKSKFGTSISSAMLIGLHVVHSRTSGSRSGLHYLPSSFWMSSYIPSTSDIISICNAIVGFSEVLKYSFPSLKVVIQKLKSRKHYFTFYLLGSHLCSRSEHNKFHKMIWLANLNNTKWCHSNPKFEFKRSQTTWTLLQTWHDPAFNQSTTLITYVKYSDYPNQQTLN